MSQPNDRSGVARYSILIATLYVMVACLLIGGLGAGALSPAGFVFSGVVVPALVGAVVGRRRYLQRFDSDDSAEPPSSRNRWQGRSD